MNFNAEVPSLEHMVLIRTAAGLWNHRDIRTVLKEELYPHLQKQKEEYSTSLRHSDDSVLQSGEEDRIWRMLEERLTREALQLQIPLSLTEKLASIVKLVGREIMAWIQNHYYHFDIHLPDQLHWSPEGIVDDLETARSLIQDEKNLDVTQRYKMACFFCIEEKVRELWEKIPTNQRRHFYIENHPERVQQHELVKFWTYTIKGEVEKWQKVVTERLRLRHSDLRRCALEYTAISCNKAAMDFFLQKLSPQEKNQALTECVREVTLLSSIADSLLLLNLPASNQTRVLKFLFSQMDERKLRAVLKYDDVKSALALFLDWPWQDYFLQVAELAWEFLHGDSVLLILLDILLKIAERREDYDCKNRFIRLWQRYPMKRDFFIADHDGVLLGALFDAGDRELIKLCLDDAPTEVKRNLVFSDLGLNHCAVLSRLQREDELKLFLWECLPDKSSLVDFKGLFEQCDNVSEISKQTVRTIIDDLIVNANN